jgi:Isochorismatase family
VALVRVAFSPAGADRLRLRVANARPIVPLPPDYSEVETALDQQPNDILITKRQWGAFFGTDLDLQLRRRQITGIVLAGIATSMGVESTARQAFEHGYNVTIAADAVTDLNAERMPAVWSGSSRCSASWGQPKTSFPCCHDSRGSPRSLWAGAINFHWQGGDQED